MRALAVIPGRAHSLHLVDVPMPSLAEVPGGRGVLVRVLRVGVDGTDKEIDAAETLVADDEVVVAGRRLSVLGFVDLDIGAVGADAEDVDENAVAVVGADVRLRRVAEVDGVRVAGSDGDGFHLHLW